MYRVVNFDTVVPASSLKEAIAIKDSIGGVIYKKERSSNDYRQFTPDNSIFVGSSFIVWLCAISNFELE